CSRITTRRPKHFELAILISIRRVLVNRVCVRIAEQQVAAIFVDPNWTLSKLEPVGQFEDFRIWTDDFIHRRIVAHNLDIYFAWRQRHWARLSLIKCQPCITDVDEVSRRIRERTIGAKNGELNLLAGFYVAADY